MKILLLPSYFFPEKAASSYITENRCSAFAEAGFDMIVFTPCPTRGINDWDRKLYQRQLKHETAFQGHMEINRFPLFKEGKNPFMRALRYLIACIKQYQYGCRNKNADVLFVASTPPIQGAMAAMVKKKTGIPIVYNLQDIFPDSLLGTGLAKKGGLLWKIGRRIEDFTYRNADKIIVISEDFKRNIMAKGVPEDKIEVIYNWVDENAVVHIEKEDNPLFEELGIADKWDRKVGQMSFGQQQRVAFIRSLCQPFDFIFLDEPISHLDDGNGRCMARILTEEAARQGAGIIVTSIGKHLELAYDRVLSL